MTQLVILRSLKVSTNHNDWWYQTAKRSRLPQQVVGLTHWELHTLDIIITCKSSTLLIGSLAVHFSIDLHTPPLIRKEAALRKYKSISCPDMNIYTTLSSHLNNVDQLLNDLIEACNTVNETPIDKRPHLGTTILTLRTNAPWHPDEIRQVKHPHRIAERTWREAKFTIHHNIFKHEYAILNELFIKSKNLYHSIQIVECGIYQTHLRNSTTIGQVKRWNPYF